MYSITAFVSFASLALAQSSVSLVPEQSVVSGLASAISSVAGSVVSTAAAPSVTPVSLDFPFTTYLQQTDSNGVVTGMPTPDASIPGLPAAITSQPAVALIPAGLANGINTVPIGNLTTLLVSVGSSTTEVIAAPMSTTDASMTGSEPSRTSGSDPSSTEDASSETSSGAAADINKVYAASSALVGFAAFFAAFM